MTPRGISGVKPKVGQMKKSYSEVSIKHTHSIKHTACLSFKKFLTKDVRYSGGWMRFYGKTFPSVYEGMKTNNIPLKSPIKLPPEIQKKFDFSKFVGF